MFSLPSFEHGYPEQVSSILMQFPPMESSIESTFYGRDFGDHPNLSEYSLPYCTARFSAEHDSTDTSEIWCPILLMPIWQAPPSPLQYHPADDNNATPDGSAFYARTCPSTSPPAFAPSNYAPI